MAPGKKKPGFFDPDDEAVQKGKNEHLAESRGWKGPSSKERKEERDIKKMMSKKPQKRDSDKASWKKQLGGVAFLVIMCGIGFVSTLMTMWSFIVGNGVTYLDVQDTAKLKTVLFGGDPWLIYCVNNETINHRLPDVLEEHARGLRSSLGLQTGVLQCFDQTSSGRSVAQRFKMRLKPPLAFIVANGNNPRELGLLGLSKSEDLEKKIKPALMVEVKRIDALKQWSSLCTSRRSCVVIGHKNFAQRDTALTFLKPLQEKYRLVKFVTVDTSFWQLKLEEGLMQSRPPKGGADVLCLTRDEPKDGGNTSFGAFFMETLSSSGGRSFVEACAAHTGVVKIKAAPRIKARPSKPKTVKASPVQAKARPRPPPSPPSAKKKAGGKVDQVGSRAALESEDEPLFEAVEESEEEETPGSEEEEAEEESDDEVEL